MKKLIGSSKFFKPGPPAPLGSPCIEVLEFIKSRVQGSILDLGGGAGAYALALKNLGHSVTLAEVDSECISTAKKAGLSILDMNITCLSNLKKKYDTVILIEVLEHIEDYKLFLKEAIGCAKKKVLFTVPCTDDFVKLFKYGLTYNHIAVSDHIHHFTSDEIAEMLDFGGYKYTIQKKGHLFPAIILSLLLNTLGSSIISKFSLLPFRLVNKFRWVPKAYPSRIEVEIILS